VTSSLILDSIYLLLAGDSIKSWVSQDSNQFPSEPRQLSLAVLILGALIPTCLAYVFHGKLTLRRKQLFGRVNIQYPVAGTGYSRVDTAWDWAGPSLGDTWVRVRLDEGTWVGGWYGGRSFTSSYPEPHDIFIEHQYILDNQGRFLEEIPNSAGVWVSIKDGAVIEWVHP
jgi:Family of unknown function (DUF6338)